jgi:cytochrome c5
MPQALFTAPPRRFRSAAAWVKPPGMTLRFLTAAALAAAALGLAAVGPVLAQPPTASDDPLPAGPGKDVVVRVCTGCHEAAQFAYARHTPDEWDNEIAKMEGAGADITGEEQATISAYLGKYLAKAPPPPP